MRIAIIGNTIFREDGPRYRFGRHSRQRNKAAEIARRWRSKRSPLSWIDAGKLLAAEISAWRRRLADKAERNAPVPHIPEPEQVTIGTLKRVLLHPAIRDVLHQRTVEGQRQFPALDRLLIYFIRRLPNRYSSRSRRWLANKR